MKKFTLQIFAFLAFAFSWQVNAQTSTLYFTAIDNGCCDTEKWVSITTGPDGTGTVIFAQGDGTYGNAQGLLTDAAFTVDDGSTYYINAYDRYDDSWDGDTYEIRSAPAGGGLLVANNGGVSPDDGNDDDATSNWGDTQAQELEVSEAFSYTPPACTFAVVNTSTIVEDCAAGTFMVNVDFTTVGDATSVSDGTTNYPISGTTAMAGPFATGTTQTLSVVHSDVVCDFTIGDFSYDDCPNIVTCGTPLNATYCYGISETTDFLYQSSDGSQLVVTFNAGQVENNWDELIILDSDGTTELYNGYGTAGDLTGLTFTSSGDAITVRIQSDGSTSCSSEGYTPWDYDVVCLACTAGEATATVIEDCGASTYTIEVNVTNTGDATTITDGTTPQTFTGTVTFGPYAFGVDTTLDVEHSDSVCDFTLGTYGFDACPPTNDDCANAELAPVGLGSCGTSVTGNNTGATDSGVAQAGCATATYAGGDIWYQFEMPAGETEIVYTRSASAFSTTQLELYSGSCGSLVEVGCTTSATASFTGLTSGDTYYVRLYDWGNDNFGAVTFCLNTPPTCPLPTALTATGITTTSADLGWTENGTAMVWDIEWGLENFTPTETPSAGTDNVGDNPYTLGGLTASTTYEFYVRSGCSVSDKSPWAGPFTFTTADLPPACGDDFYDTGGVASDYSNSANITTTICPDVTGDAVDVTFTFFSTENNGASACFDGLTIHNGADATAATIDPPGGGTIWCWDRDDATPGGTGDLQGMTISSTDASGCLTFVFTSDSSVTREGWEATVGCSPLTLEDFGLTGFTYYPNPVQNTLTLKGVSNINNVAVYNMLGQEVLRTAPNTMASEVDMSNLQTGAYFVKVTIGGATKTIRVIKN
ncbi:Por secretion system C-terminal sorting domain-containing protein [Bizionia echini]|uniref:Por secretion system C-terminal sorting domain-containing protein n=1 Tax=Bizionia echini TaxID=649333 RepID=A0A1I5BN80_9FLAO|nr:T9SS type A sorting domain-containing protein [Bizionia echini]SFN76215.1 Por secretion system C-terminal sorting domain-containing protein [Bizionia echini]